MKKTVFISVIAAFLAIGNVNAQSEDEGYSGWRQEDAATSSDVYVKPKFQGGEKAFFQYFENKIQMSEKIKCKSFSCKTFCTFNIDENGEITDVAFQYGGFKTSEYYNNGEQWSYEHGFDFINNQILAVLKDMPNLIPAKLNGKNVASQIKFAVQYEYANGKSETKYVKILK